jgi:hypothetical protein
MAALVTEDIQLLLDQPKRQGLLVSCYADTSVSGGFSHDWLQHFKTEASRIRQQLAADHPARIEFERNAELIRQSLESTGSAYISVTTGQSGPGWHWPRPGRTPDGSGSPHCGEADGDASVESADSHRPFPARSRRQWVGPPW